MRPVAWPTSWWTAHMLHVPFGPSAAVQDPSKRFQRFLGFGGSFTESSADLWQRMPAEMQDTTASGCWLARGRSRSSRPTSARTGRSRADLGWDAPGARPWLHLGPAAYGVLRLLQVESLVRGATRQGKLELCRRQRRLPSPLHTRQACFQVGQRMSKVKRRKVSKSRVRPSRQLI